MLATCPHCAFSGEVEAFFVDDEGKRLAAAVAELPAECGRAVFGYLRLFKPAKTGLRTARAVKLARELVALIAAGDVCKDERSGVRRPATPGMWAQGIEQMLAQRDRLSLPLESHGYLRAVVYGIADSVDAAAERKKEADARIGRNRNAASEKSEAKRSARAERIAWARQMHRLGTAEYDDAWLAGELEKAKELPDG